MADRPTAAHPSLTAGPRPPDLDPLLTACRALIAAHDGERSRTVAIEAIRAALAEFNPPQE